RGAPAQALALAASGLDAAERLDAPGFRATARLSIGLAHLLERNWDEAIAAIRDAKRIATPETIGPNQYLMVLARLAEACLGKGDRQTGPPQKVVVGHADKSAVSPPLAALAAPAARGRAGSDISEMARPPRPKGPHKKTLVWDPVVQSSPLGPAAAPPPT